MTKDIKWFKEEFKYIGFQPAESEYSVEMYGQIEKLVDQLEVQEEIVVKPFVADWFEKNKGDITYGIYTVMNDIKRIDFDKLNSIQRWFNFSNNNPIETIVKMKDGYTIEQEKMYRVKFPGITRSNNSVYLEKSSFMGDKVSVDWSNKEYVEDGGVSYTFTEKEIKAIHPGYWSFAEEVIE